MDTNVLISALRSNQGASFQLLRRVDCQKFQLCLSVPLVLEYEASAKEIVLETALTRRDIDDVIDYVCTVAEPVKIYFLWRPVLRDPKDDMVLELAVTAGCDAIVTFNKSDFLEAVQFRIKILTPKELLEKIGELP